MTWNIEGTFYENCSCDAICPCTWSNLAHRATRDYCRFVMAFDVERGSIEDVDVSDRRFVLVGETPPQMDQGNWRVGVFVDEGASEQQVAQLAKMLSGELGGPPAALGPLLAEFLGVEQAPISIERDGDRFHVRVGDGIDYAGSRLTVSGGEAVSLTNIIVHPAGPTLTVAPVERATVSAFGFGYEGSDLSGFSNPFRWSA